MIYRCKLVTADGAYRYINWHERPPQSLSFAILKTITAHMWENPSIEEAASMKRDYELFDRLGKVWIYHERV